MTVATILNTKGTDIVSITPTTTVAEAAKFLKQHQIGAVLVLESDAIAGILSERDIVRALADLGSATLDKSVGDLMTKDVITVGPNASVNEVMTTMVGKRIRHLPVVTGGKLTGIISIGDVVNRRLKELEEESDSLKQYVAGGY